MLDHVLLGAAERVEAENFAQDGGHVGHGLRQRLRNGGQEIGLP